MTIETMSNLRPFIPTLEAGLPFIAALVLAMVGINSKWQANRSKW